MEATMLRQNYISASPGEINERFQLPIGGDVVVDFDSDLPRECKVVSYVPPSRLHLVVAKMKQGTQESIESRYMAFATVLRQKGGDEDMIGRDIAVFPSSRFMFEMGPPASSSRISLEFRSDAANPNDGEIIVARVCRHSKGLRAYLWTPLNKLKSHVRSRLRNGIYRARYRQLEGKLHREGEVRSLRGLNTTVYVCGKANLAREFQSRVWLNGDRWTYTNVDLTRLTSHGWVDCWDLALDLSKKN